MTIFISFIAWANNEKKDQDINLASVVYSSYIQFQLFHHSEVLFFVCTMAFMLYMLLYAVIKICGLEHVHQIYHRSICKRKNDLRNPKNDIALFILQKCLEMPRNGIFIIAFPFKSARQNTEINIKTHKIWEYFNRFLYNIFLLLYSGSCWMVKDLQCFLAAPPCQTSPCLL